MSEPNPVVPPVDPTNPNPAPGADPKPPVTPEASTFDPSKLSDDDFAKLYDEPRLYKHSRFKDLTDKASKAKEYETKEQKAAEEKLKEEKKFQELLDLKEKELTELRGSVTQSKLDAAILGAVTKKGIKDPDAALKLIDRSTIKVNDAGEIEGIDLAVEALAKDKPYLLTINRSAVGTGTSPTDPGTGERIKMSQVQDPVFYRAHQAEIKAAFANGTVDDDRFTR